MADSEQVTDPSEPQDAAPIAGDGGSGEPEWVPPTRDEWDRTQKALAKANTEAKQRREKLAQLQAETEDANTKAAREQAEAAQRKYKPVAVRAAAKAAFLEAGLQGGTADRVAKLTRLLDLDAIEIDDEGDVTGLDEQIKAVKADYPELFGTGERKPPRINASDRPGTNGRPKRSSDLLAAQALGG